MTSQPPEEPRPEIHALDDPEKQWKTVRVLLICSPFAFFGSYILAWLQGAEPSYAGLIALVALAMCLGAAGAIWLMGSKSWIGLVALKVAILLFNRR